MKTETKAMNLTEAETKEIEKDVASIDVNRANFEYIAKTGKINGNLLVDIKRLVTAMAEKKNLETKVWKNTADEFKKYNADLKAQLEAAQAELERMKSEYDEVVDHEWVLDSELERVKAVATRAAVAMEQLMSFQNGPPLPTYEKGWTLGIDMCIKALTEFANLMNKEK